MDADDDQKDEPGQLVADQTRETVHLGGAYITAVDEVEDLHEDEGVEDQREVLLLVSALSGLVRSGVGEVEDVLAHVHNDHHDSCHKDHHSKDLAVHLRGHDVALTSLVLGDVSGRAGRGQGQSSEDVHNQVDPDKLHWVQHRLSHRDEGNNDDNEHSKAAGDLELKESLHVHVDVAAPHDGAHAGVKVVGLEDHGSVVAGV